MPSPVPPSGRPLALFDLDNTLLDGRTILRIGDRFGIRHIIEAIWAEAKDAEMAAGIGESERIAKMFAGVAVEDFKAACTKVPLRRGAKQAVDALKKMGFEIGVASATYTYATSAARKKLGLDFDVGVGMEEKDGKLTGHLVPGAYSDGTCGQFVCKEHVLARRRKENHSSFTVAVGDGRNDVCMIRIADLGVGIEPCHLRVREAADVVVQDLRQIPRAVEMALAHVGTGVTPAP